MRRYGLLLVFAAAAGLVVTAQDKGPPPPTDAEAAIKAPAGEYAKAAAAFWTAEGELTDAHRGRAAIEAAPAEQFKVQPRAAVTLAVESVRVIARGTAVATGSVTATLPGEPPAETGYSGVFAREGDAWKLAALSEWHPDPADDTPLTALDWLAGEWAATGAGGTVKLVYAWDGTKTFLRGTYTATKDGKPVAAGTHVLGRDPAGGLRGWVFENTGAIGDEGWVQDGPDGWLVDSANTAPDGTVLMAVNVLRRLGPDAFTWQPTVRSAGTTPLPDLPPVKATRVNAAK